MRPTTTTIINIKKYSKVPKWARLNLFLKEKKSFDSSVKLLRKKTILQFSSKCKEIYRIKLLIHLITKKNWKSFKFFSNSKNFTKEKEISSIENEISRIKVTDSSELELDLIENFFFHFRKNNRLILKLIECADQELYKILVPFLCHFFYENFYIESNEQEEILYIIYLLLEKEIDLMFSPSISTFLDQSFLSKFLVEFGNRFEVKRYITLILNEPISDVEDQYIDYYSLDIIHNEPKNEEEKNKYFNNEENGLIIEQVIIEENNNQKRYDSLSGCQKIDKISLNKEEFYRLTKQGAVQFPQDNNQLYLLKKELTIKTEICQILFNNLTEKFFRNKIEEEKDIIMKEFYIRLLRKIQSSNEPDLYNGDKYYKKLISETKIYYCAIKDFNNAYTLVTKCIDDILTNLENEVIAPYSIKVICKLIYILLQKKFKKIPKIQIYLLINQFIFDKLIYPNIKNPKINEEEKNIIISMSTRKNLSNVILVLQKLIRGELFSFNEQEDYLMIFNEFIIAQFFRIKSIIEKFINVSIPHQILKLTEDFYKDENFNLASLNKKRKDADVTYNYFIQNKTDFMNYISICFSKNEFFLFYDIVKKNIGELKTIDPSLEAKFKIIEKNIVIIIKKFNEQSYYVGINNEYRDKIVKYIFQEEEKILFGDKNKSTLDKIKFCIKYLISNIQISQKWGWVTDKGVDTLTTFKFIHKFLNGKNLLDKNKKIPLTWYSSFLVDHLKDIKSPLDHDYESLYDMLESELTYELIQLRHVNNFLAINMSSKFSLIDKQIKAFEQELNFVKYTDLSIKVLQLIEKSEIKVCLFHKNDIDILSQYSSYSLDCMAYNSPNIFILSSDTQCIHNKLIEQKNMDKFRTNEKKYFKKNHCKKINQFCNYISEFSKDIYDDIYEVKNESKIQVAKNKKLKQLPKEILENMLTTKDLLEHYMIYVNEEIKKNIICDYNENEGKIIYEKVGQIIWNYILKFVYIKLCNDKLNESDNNFYTKCKELSWIKPKQFDITKELYNSNLFKRAEYHIKKMDKLHSPSNIIYEFGISVQLINAIFIFMLNKMNIDADDLQNSIIFTIIGSKPKKIIFNIKFIKYFMSEKLLLGKLGNNISRAEISTIYIQGLNAERLKMDEKQFKEKCQSALKLSDKSYNNKVNNK